MIKHRNTNIIGMTDVKSQEYTSLNNDSNNQNSNDCDNEMILDDDYVIGSNLELPSVPDSTLDPSRSSKNPELSSPQSTYSSSHSNDPFTKTGSRNIESETFDSVQQNNSSPSTNHNEVNNNINNERRKSCVTDLREDSLENSDDIDDSAINGFSNMSEKLTKNLAIKYNTLSENKQNELEILKKMEYFLLKYKWYSIFLSCCFGSFRVQLRSTLGYKLF